MTPETAVIPIAAREVAVAERASQPQNRRSNGTMTTPPPTPNNALTASLHYRGSEDEDAAHAALEDVKARAQGAGFVARFGRKVLEILPSLEVHKGTAVRQLLAERELKRALYAGDDTTDLDAFRALEGLELAVRVAVSS